MSGRDSSNANWRSVDAEAQLRAARWLCAIGAIAYPSFGIAYQLAEMPAPDLLWLRIGITLAIVAVGASTYVSARARRHVHVLLLVLMYVITTHAYLLLAMNDLHASAVVGTLVVLTGFVAAASYAVSTRRQLVAYLVYTVAACGAVALAADEPKSSPFQLVLSIATVTALAYVAVRAQLDTLRRIVASEAELRHDVARREETEQALRASEARTKALLLAVPDVMMRLGRDGTVREVLTAQQDKLSDVCAEREGERLSEMLESEGNGDAVRAALGTVLEDDLRVVTLTGKLEGAEDRQVEVRFARAGGDEALALLRDVTEARAMEELMRRTERLASLGTLASGVAHEINNPLTYVLGNLDHVLHRLDSAGALDRDELRGVLVEAREGAERIRHIVRDLHDHGRAKDDAISSVDANDVVRAALRMLSNQLRHRALLDVKLAEVPMVRANDSRLVQVLVNLLTNSLQALPRRSSYDNLISVVTRTEGDDAVVIEVGDNGPGIPAGMHSRIFDPFFTTHAASGGTGLGLYLSHQIVSAFGGELSALDRPGGGALFRIVLRRGASSIAAPAEALSDGEVGDVLVVDDNRLVGRAIARLFRGRDVVVVGSVEEALAITEKHDFQVILCDLMMPAKDGSVLYRALEAVRPEQARRIVFMTGGVFADHLHTFLESVGNPCIRKPLHRDELLRAVRAVAPQSRVA